MKLNDAPQLHETNQGDNMKQLSSIHVLGHDGDLAGQIQWRCLVESRKDETCANVVALIVTVQQRN